jgi:hypothetical protein
LAVKSFDTYPPTSTKSCGATCLQFNNYCLARKVVVGKRIDTAPDDNETLEQDQPIPAFPASSVCAGWSCRQGDGCPKYPNLSAFSRRRRNAKSSNAKAGNEGSEGDKAGPGTTTPVAARQGVASRAEPLLVFVFAGHRQRDRRLARAYPALKPVYVFVTAPISPTPDLREDVAARVGETGHRMLLVYRVEGCFREAVEALKRSV